MSAIERVHCPPIHASRFDVASTAWSAMTAIFGMSVNYAEAARRTSILAVAPRCR
jgi:hypothetical protein